LLLARHGSRRWRLFGSLFIFYRGRYGIFVDWMFDVYWGLHRMLSDVLLVVWGLHRMLVELLFDFPLLCVR
jgi:hypothetical protein